MFRSHAAAPLAVFALLGLAACNDDNAVSAERTPAATTTATSATTASPTGASTMATAAPMGSSAAAPSGATTVEVPLTSAANASIQGKATLVEEKDGVRVTVSIDKAPPGAHGLHFHEKGDCSAKDFSSAGAHLRLPEQKHGLPTGAKHDGHDPKGAMHMGDLGNIKVDAEGKGKLEHFVAGVNLRSGAEHSLLDKAIVLHEKEDKGTGESGDSGGRIGCAVIKSGATGAASATATPNSATPPSLTPTAGATAKPMLPKP